MNYAHPEVLVDTQWVAEHLSDRAAGTPCHRQVRIIEADIDITSYNSGHIPGAIFWNALTTIMQPDYRFNFNSSAFSELLARSGITNDTTIIIYSNHNAGAHCAFWFLKVFGHNDVRVMNGGCKKWLLEKRPVSTEIPTITPTIYTVNNFDISIRALPEQVQAAINTDSVLLDVRTAQEYCGELFMMKPPEKTERAGHIPSAVHLFYESALNEDDTFKSAEELYALYANKGITPNKEVITYCAVGARSSNTWFVLKYLLGYDNVRNYDGSWNEWSSLPDAPVET
jgi:thiosulfate/3-mercaptopyruvate sulfurtransferase